MTGIWQTVWLEPVPSASIASIEIIPDVDASMLTLNVHARGVNMETHMADKFAVQAEVFDGTKQVSSGVHYIDSPIKLRLEKPKLWSPDSPFLYDLKITLSQQEQVLDQVSSYFAMRKISLGKDENGINRLFLNGKPLFQYGPLDQGQAADRMASSFTCSV